MTIDLSPYLEPDERLLWQGRPCRSFAFLTKADYFSFGLGLAWLLFLLTITLVRSDAKSGFTLAVIFWLPLVLSFWLSIGRMWTRMRYLQRTRYATTNKRAMSLCDHPVRTVASYSADKGAFHWCGRLFPSILFAPKFEKHLTLNRTNQLPLWGRKDYFFSCNPMLLNGFFDIDDLDGALMHLRALENKEPRL